MEALVEAVGDLTDFLEKGNENLSVIRSNNVATRKDIEQIQITLRKFERLLLEGNGQAPMVVQVALLVQAQAVLDKAIAEKKTGVREWLKERTAIIVALIALLAQWGPGIVKALLRLTN